MGRRKIEKMTCPECKGTKITTICIGMKREEYGCGYCENEGFVKDCPNCKGRGMIDGQYCQTCRFRFGLVPLSWTKESKPWRGNSQT